MPTFFAKIEAETLAFRLVTKQSLVYVLNDITKHKTELIKYWSSPFHTIINPFVPNAPFLYPLKTSENLKVF